jgi:GT2 family glycosyltransferase
MAIKKPAITVIIVSYKCPEPLKETLSSVMAQRYEGPVETVVVDNASRDETPEIVKRFPNVKLIESRENLGFARANNLGAREGEGDFLFILNPDIVLPQGLLSRLADYLTDDPRVGAVGPTLIEKTGRLQKYCAWKNYTTAAAIADVIGLSEGLPRRFLRAGCFYPHDLYYGEPKEVFSLSGSCALIRKEAFLAAGGFDERYFLFGEDLDLFRTIRRKGFRVVYLPSEPVVHMTGASMASFNPVVRIAGIESPILYNQKYRGAITGLMLMAAAYFSASARLAFFSFGAALRPEETAASRRARYYQKVIEILSRKKFW